MSESGGISASSLALATEKKPQRSGGGGCVGLLYQLFDWNRRFAKKNFFSKKLLPPDLCKQGSKKFGGEEKQPKLRLIADENSGGFPSNMKTNKFCSVKSEKKSEMRPPGLVARLMGLDSMPAVSRDNKPKKVSLNDQSSPATNENEENKFVEEDPIFVKMRDLRPQKIQKTGTSERSPVTRFGAEALQIKNMLSRSKRKKSHHHPKLASPLKSSRNVPGTRLIGVANKILDPRGMQKRSRGKYLLTSSDTLHPPSSCRNCGHSLDIVDSRPDQEQESFQIPCQDSETSVPKVSSYFFREQKERRAFAQSSYIIGPTQHGQKNSQMFPGRYNKVPERAISINETKDAVALNKSVNGCTRMRMPTKAERCDFETERRLSNRRAESLSPVRKRRSMNVTRQSESSGSISLSSGKDYSMSGKEQSGSKQDSGIAPFTFRSPVDKRTALPRKSTTVILQELKSALTAESQFHKDGFNVRSNRNNTISHSLNSSTKFLDTSLAKAKFYKPLVVTGLSNSITEVLQKSKLFYGYLKGCKLEYAKEVILNAELVVGNFSITRFVLEDLDMLACVIMMRYSDILGFQTAKHDNQLKGFVFDCVLEFLDSKCGLGARTKLPPFMNTEMLVFEILEEVKLWAAMTGLAHDELLEWDMNRSLGKWTGFDIEVMECSAEIGHQLVEKLVEEVVNDL